MCLANRMLYNNNTDQLQYIFSYTVEKNVVNAINDYARNTITQHIHTNILYNYIS